MKTANPIGRGANTCAKMKKTTKLIIRNRYNNKPGTLLEANTVQFSFSMHFVVITILGNVIFVI
jgi:hypothetical protein